MSLTKKDLQQISKVVQTNIEPLKRDISSVKKDVRSLTKDQKLIIKSFDMMIYKHHRRLDRLEAHTGLPPLAN